MKKICGTCKQNKSLDNFFTPPEGASARWQGTSEHCKECHSAGLISNGYGDKKFNGRYNSPSDC